MDILDKLQKWGYSKGLDGIRRQIRKVVKDGRLQFLDDDSVTFIDKRGKVHVLTFDKMASEAIEIGGWADQMAKLGITHKDIVDILKKEYSKQEVNS